MQTLTIICAIFLFISMFFFRIALFFGYRLPRQFIGVQITTSILLIFLHATIIYSPRAAILFIAISTGVGLFMEIIGVKTGWIFGKYKYTDDTGPKIFGLVPVFIPLWWCVIGYMSLSMTKLILINYQIDATPYRLVLILLSAILVTLWDVLADPLAIDEGGWIWEKGGRFYGIPFSNFFGWFFTAIIIFFTYLFINEIGQTTPVSSWFEYLPAFGYCAITAVFARACLERQMWIPATIGFFVAGFGLVYWFYRVFN